MRNETVRCGQGWARITPWRGDRTTAHLVLGPGARPCVTDVTACLDRARAAGYRTVLTGALNDDDTEPFAVAGLRPQERLHVLARDVLSEPPPPSRALGRAAPWDRRRIVGVDDLAFAPFWRLGRVGVEDAKRATPSSRLRIGRGHGRVSAYAITGRADDLGYLQRIAVHPEDRRCGWGRALVSDALSWLWRTGARRAYVNTQLDNGAALDLYRACGFDLLPEGLCVMTGDL